MRSVAIFGIALLAATTGYVGVAPSQDKSLVDQYCVTCHSERLKTGNLVLEKLDASHAADNSGTSETWEKVIRKVRAGMMPPAGAPRPF